MERTKNRFIAYIAWYDSLTVLPDDEKDYKEIDEKDYKEIYWLHSFIWFIVWLNARDYKQLIDEQQSLLDNV